METIKHIRRKFQGEIKNPASLKALEAAGKFTEIKDVARAKIEKGYNPHLITDDGTIIPCFVHKLHGKTYVIPEPDPVLIYFNNAQTNFRSIEEAKKELLQCLDYGEAGPPVSEISHSLYNYMYSTSGFVIFLFTAMEAAINKSIPNSFVYRFDRNGKWTEVYNFEQIQKSLSFESKIKQVLFQITNKDFSKAHPLQWTHVDNLKKFRDAIIHTKKHDQHHTPYSYIFKLALNFNYAATIIAVRDFINFYQPGLIEPCPCGEDF